MFDPGDGLGHEVYFFDAVFWRAAVQHRAALQTEGLEEARRCRHHVPPVLGGRREVEVIVLFDIHGVAHLVHNEKEVRETHERWRYVENWQVRVACAPTREAHNALELHGSAGNPGINQADLSDETKGHYPTCILCVGAINMGVR